MTASYDDLHTLYQAARPDEEPTVADRRAVRAAIMGAGITVATLHASSAAGKVMALVPAGAKMFTLGQVVTYALVGVAIGGGIATVGTVVGHKAASPTVLATAMVPGALQANPSSGATPAASQSVEANENAELSTAASVGQPANAGTGRAPQMSRGVSKSPAELPEVPTPPGATPVTSATPSLPSLADESRGLAEVQVALNAGNSNLALQLLDQQDRAYRGGSLAQEREAARVIALCTAHRAEANVAKERFISAYPGSPLARRVILSCTGSRIE